jgi:hypothetical protein
MGTPDDAVGSDIPAEAPWRAVGASYAKGMAGPYHEHRTAVIKVLLMRTSPTPRTRRSARRRDACCRLAAIGGHTLQQTP